MRSISNLQDVISYMDYLKEIDLDKPRGGLVSVPVTTEIFDKIALQLWNRNLTYTDLTHYTEITLSENGVVLQIKIYDYYNDSITKLKNQL